MGLINSSKHTGLKHLITNDDDLVGEEQITDLPIFNKLYRFFENKENELEFKFNELIN